MIKIIKAIAFQGAVEVDEQGKITNAPKIFSQFINMPLSILENTLKKNKFHSLTIEDVQED
jgi:hypothetical protein